MPLVVHFETLNVAMQMWEKEISRIGHRDDVSAEAYKEFVELQMKMYNWKIDRIMDGHILVE